MARLKRTLRDLSGKDLGKRVDLTVKDDTTHGRTYCMTLKRVAHYGNEVGVTLRSFGDDYMWDYGFTLLPDHEVTVHEAD